MRKKDFVLEYSFDDGYVQDMRVASILNRFGFKATFFIPNKTDLLRDEILQLVKDGHTIGGHTVSHPQDLKLLDDESLKYEIEENRAWLQELTGQKVEDFCYPRGRYDERVMQAVRDAGYKTARTTAIGWHFNLPDNFRKATTVHTYNRREYEGVTWQEYARKMLDKALYAAKSGNGVGYYHLWGHSFLEYDRFDWWDDFENLIEFIHENIRA
jgi:peptidoglycan-N-acetylglucosamine deacetylase